MGQSCPSYVYTTEQVKQNMGLFASDVKLQDCVHLDTV